jgi:pyruvate/2-oxoglutarate dehydrogenase complex dihydrolipoamide dehydrogenase (E3) component
VDRAITDHATAGFIQIVHDKKGKLLGATVVSPNAGEVINELTLALQKGMKVSDISLTMHAYPTIGIGAQILAGDQTMAGLMRGLTGKVIRYLASR